MYKNNSRFCSKFKGYCPLQLYRKLKDLYFEIAYFLYTHRCCDSLQKPQQKLGNKKKNRFTKTQVKKLKFRLQTPLFIGIYL